MSYNNCTILWIPQLWALGKEPISIALKQALEDRHIFDKQLFYLTEIAPQGFPLGREILLDVASFGFSFPRLGFEESEVHKGYYNVTQNALTIGVKLNDVGKYPPIELAEYFKRCWIPHHAV